MAKRLRDFNSFYGQQRVVQVLRDLADEALARGTALPPILLIGRAGAGKSSLAEALARHLANHSDEDAPSNFHVVHAGRGVARQTRDLLSKAKHGDVLLVDEAHALAQEDAELLYLAVDRQQTLAVDDTGRLNRTQFEPIANLTLILATNIPGRLPKALRSRALPVELEEYSVRELREITHRVAQAHAVDFTPQAARVVAERADGSPRRVEQIVLLVASMPCPARVTQTHLEGVLHRALGLDDHGLSPRQQELMRLLGSAPGATLRAEQVVTALGLDAVYVRAEVEDPLVRQSLLVIRTDHRRQLTIKGQALAITQPDNLMDSSDDETSDE